MKIPELLKPIARRFSEAGFSCYLVGGAVRDMVQGQEPSDYDLATDADPQSVVSLFRRVIPTGIKHGTVTVLHGDHKIEVTTFRTETGYSDSRHPDAVEFTPSLFEDLKRRDFTINSMAIDIGTGELADPHGGRRDLKDGIIRAIGNPAERFNEDALRSLRACRFAATLGFRIEKETMEAIRNSLGGIPKLSVERVRDEILKILGAVKPSTGFVCMDEAGILPIVLPELSACKGVDQKGMHRYDVYTHLLLSCDGAPKDNLPVRLAALLHDIGKPAARAVDANGIVTFHRHEQISEEMAHAVLRRLKLPVLLEKQVCLLVAQHMFNYTPDWSDSAVRRFVAKAGRENLDDLFLLREADHYGMIGERVPMPGLYELQDRIASVLARDEALSLKSLKVDGDDLADAGIPRGKKMGAVLAFLLETVLDDPEMNDREKLLRTALSYYRTKLEQP